VQLDDGDFRRESTWPPAERQTLYVFDWRDIPAGEYEIVAAIGAGDHVRASDRQTVTLAAP